MVTLRGDNAGDWYHFTQSVGGGPIGAIQHQHGLQFKEAVELAAELTGLDKKELSELCDEQVEDTKSNSESGDKIKRELPAGVPDVSEKKIANMFTARAMWNASVPLQGGFQGTHLNGPRIQPILSIGTLAERYLVNFRGIDPDTIPHLQFRFIGASEKYKDEIRGDRISNSALIVPVRNPQDELTGVQRIFLNEKSGAKVAGFWYTKKSKGILKGSAGIVQVSDHQGAGEVLIGVTLFQIGNSDTLYLAEGPETGASVASVMGPDVTILASLSLSLIPVMKANILRFKPKRVIWAADYDVSLVAQRAAYEAKQFLAHQLGKEGIEFHAVVPTIEDMDEDTEKGYDFNDVLKLLGPEELLSQLLPKNHQDDV